MKFEVKYRVTLIDTHTVEAETLEEAEQKSKFEDGERTWSEMEGLEVLEAKQLTEEA